MTSDRPAPISRSHPERRRMNRGDVVIMLGFWSQFVFLFLVDAGTVYAMRQGLVAEVHYVGIVLVNVVCLAVGFMMYRWLRHRVRPPTCDEHAQP